MSHQPLYPHQVRPGIEYRIVARYEPQDINRCIECEADDVIFVQLPFVFEFHGTEQQPDGWLYGLNTRTNLRGYVPAAFVRHIRTYPLSAPPPPRPPLPDIPEVTDDPGSGQDPPPVPRRPGASKVNNAVAENSIQDEIWYWGQVTREEVNEILRDTANGTYLVRDASAAPGDYTLTLRKDGLNKLIRIYCRNGMYGFSPPFQFRSVREVIEYHRRVSLRQYNEDLDVCLQYPAPREAFEQEVSQEEIYHLCEQLHEVHIKVVEHTNEYEKLCNECNRRQQSIQHNKTAIDAYTKTIEIFEKQCSVLELCLNKGNHDESRLMDNFKRLQARLQVIVEQRQDLEEKLDREIQENRRQDFQSNSLKGEIHNEKKHRDNIIMQLRAAGVSDHEINDKLHLGGELEDEEDIYSVMPVDDEENLKRKFPKHSVRENWFFSNFEREDATRLLSDKRTGTFLIRPSRKAAFACSLVANGKVHHCLIQYTGEGYGFAEPFNLHQSVDDLVLHYAQNSLIPHNDRLDTMLLYPAGCCM